MVSQKIIWKCEWKISTNECASCGNTDGADSIVMFDSLSYFSSLWTNNSHLSLSVLYI
jgi:hypothetical protein